MLAKQEGLATRRHFDCISSHICGVSNVVIIYGNEEKNCICGVMGKWEDENLKALRGIEGARMETRDALRMTVD
jgi:hypothetical protein